MAIVADSTPMDKRWLYQLWRRIPWPVQRIILWSGNARFTAGVLALITDGEGRVLLLRHDYRRVGQWGLPGGWLKGNEGPAAALVRELREETGLAVEVGEVLAVFRAGDMQRLDMIYRCRVTGGQLKLNDEIAEAHYFAANELPADMFPSQVELIRRVVGREE